MRVDINGGKEVRRKSRKEMNRMRSGIFLFGMNGFDRGLIPGFGVGFIF
jgi:hypothetical protein